jgi:protein TonB
MLHGLLIAGAVVGTAKVVLPPREKVEEHPILYVASPPPPPVHIAPEPLPAVKTPPKAKALAKAPPEPKRIQTPPRPAQPQPKVPTLTLVAPTKVPVTLAAVDLKATPTIGDVVAPSAPEPIGASGIPREGSVKSSDDGDVEGGGRRKGGLGSGDAGKAYDENQVERAVQVTRAAAPRYPDALKSVGVEGTVTMRFIVGADGRVEPGSIEVIATPHKLFGDAVRTALLNTRYRPAEAGGHSVRQLVEQTFTFKLEK